MAAGERPPIPDRLQELIEDRLEGLPRPDPRSARGRLGLVDTNARCDRCRDRSFRGRPSPWSGHRERGRGGRRRSPSVHPPPPCVRRLSEDPAGSASRAARAARDDRPRSGGTSPPPGSVRRGPGRRRRRRPRGGRPSGLLPGAPQSAAELWEMARRATPPDRGEDLVRRTHQAGVAHHECGDTSLARSVLEQAVDLSMAGPARARVLLDLGMALAENEGVAGGLGRVRGCSGRGGGRSRAEGTDRAEPRVRLAVPGRPRGIGTARSRSAAAGRGAAGTTGDGRGVHGVSIRRVPPRTRGRSGAARSRDLPGRAHGGRIQIPCPACELHRGSAPQVHRSPGRGPADVHRAPG